MIVKIITMIQRVSVNSIMNYSTKCATGVCRMRRAVSRGVLIANLSRVSVLAAFAIVRFRSLEPTRGRLRDSLPRWCNDAAISRVLLSFIHFYMKHLFSLYAISHARQIYATRNSRRAASGINPTLINTQWL